MDFELDLNLSFHNCHARSRAQSGRKLAGKKGQENSIGVKYAATDYPGGCRVVVA